MTVNDDTNPLGTILISYRAIATIAYQAALQSYGVVGFAPKNLAEGLAQVLVKDPTRGVDIQYDDDRLVINLFIIVEYGTRIKSVAASVTDNVRYQVEKTIGLPVYEINIHVRGLRVSNLD
ncbi:MAG TPA: Asp23/Gls24 family envelope stress response protein [Anaerolineaceae bacterium]|nr:Asp23/Gls24 family envelope stress response protein [Anaerolineaceae bacterium]